MLLPAPSFSGAKKATEKQASRQDHPLPPLITPITKMKKTNRRKKGEGVATDRTAGEKYRQGEEKRADRTTCFFHLKHSATKNKDLCLKERGVDLHFFFFLVPG